MDRKILRICTAVILCAALARLLSNYDIMQDQSKVASAVLFLGTGRVARLEETEKLQPVEETVPTVTEPEQTALRFSQEDAALLEIQDFSGVNPNPEELLQLPLSWDLTGEEPTVLILHTHATESYTPTEDYIESSDFRTLDEKFNVVSVGDHLAALLSRQGISVLHDKTLHDYPSYNGSYSNARQTLSRYLEEYPSIRLVLDIHRDAMSDSSGSQIGYTVSIEQGTAAQVMLVVGSNHSGWKDNAALAAKLQVQLEKLCPGICRPLVFRQSRFNQDLSQGAVLIELGAAGNTRQEALLSAEYIADAILSLAQGTE